MLELLFDFFFSPVFGLPAFFLAFCWLLGRGVKNGSITPLEPEELSGVEYPTSRVLSLSLRNTRDV